MKKNLNIRGVWIYAAAIAMGISISTPSQADLFGGDVVVLTQVLFNAIQQLEQLRSILGTGQDSLDLMRSINKGINDSLGLMRTAYPNSDPGIYSDWQRVQQALHGVNEIYGAAVPSADFRIQRDADTSTAEAVSLNNSIYNYAAQIDQVGEQVKDSSHTASPAGAEKLTAETLGVMLHVMNESLRAQATGLKIQAQTLAIQNHKDKESTKQLISDSESLKSALKSNSAEFSIPRF